MRKLELRKKQPREKELDLNAWQHLLFSALSSKVPANDISNYINHVQNIDIYRRNSRFALIEVLKTNFSNCCQLLGDGYFELLAKQFVQSRLPKNNNLDFYDQAFVDFIRDKLSAEGVLADKPYLADVAVLDYLLVKSYHAGLRAEFPIQTFVDLSQQQQAMTVFVLARDVFLMRSAWPLHKIFALNKGQIDSLKLCEHDGDYCLLIQHIDARANVENVCAQTYQMMRLIQDGVTLNTLLDICPEKAASITQFIRDGLIVGFVHEEHG